MPATFRELKRFCENNGWECFKQTDHDYYRKILDNGEILVTKVSRALQKEIPNPVWHKILKQQLKITEQEFKEHLKGR